MGCWAVPQMEKEFEGKIWSRSSSSFSFSVWHLTPEEERLLRHTTFYHWLGDEGTGYTELVRADVEEYWCSLRPEERYRIKDLVNILLSDMEEFGTNGDFIQYNVG